MMTLIKVLVVLAWLLMVLLVIFAPSGSVDTGEEVIFYASEWGSEVEREFLRTLKTLPYKSQLMIVDDGTDLMRSQVIERLMVRNPGVVGIRTKALN